MHNDLIYELKKENFREQDVVENLEYNVTMHFHWHLCTKKQHADVK